ncbi:MAG: tyrosine-protein phosphatase [Pyrinomonadaceae bacterium]
MSVQRNKLLPASVLICALALAGLAQKHSRYSELPNFYQVDAQLYRGGQPETGGLQKLKELGVKTVVNLRGEDHLARAEETEARSLGLRYYAIALPGFSRPRDEEVQRILQIINARENQPVFVHCHHGHDRTGVIVACYHISHDGWTARQAKNEAQRYGLSWTEIGMKKYIDEYYDRAHRKNISTRSPSATSKDH